MSTVEYHNSDDENKQNSSKVVLADLQILLAALLFGIGFIGQRAVSVEGLGPMTCNALRFGLSAIFLIIALPWIRGTMIEHKTELIGNNFDESLNISNTDTIIPNSFFKQYFSFLNPLLNTSTMNNKLLFSKLKNTVLFWGCLLGVINFAGSGFQQWGIATSSASKVGFIAGFDIFLTPIFALCIPSFKKNGKPTPSLWLAVGLSLIGLYLLSGSSLEDMDIGFGETLTIISTVFWTLHITYTDIATEYVDSLHMIVVQFVVVTFLVVILNIIIILCCYFFC